MTPLLHLRLPDHVFAARGRQGVEVGAVFDIIVVSDLLAPRAYEDTAGWFDVTDPEQGQTRFSAIEGSHYAFAGRVSRTFSLEEDDLPLTYLQLATPIPITLVTSTFDAPLAAPAIRPDDWVHGRAALHLQWDDSLDVPLAAAVQVMVQAIRRTFLRPGPQFGQAKDLASLPPAALGPDLVELTCRVLGKRC